MLDQIVLICISHEDSIPRIHIEIPNGTLQMPRGTSLTYISLIRFEMIEYLNLYFLVDFIYTS
jgi:hypothetical protein